ncbi:MAG: ABC transporter permease [Deltaproteobacteria bacterium]|nr:MAG: ABC transporter permease [Deltaproteobacteria bacterium]
MLAVRQALRELRRRRVRSALTTGGIAIGVAALVLLGALSEKMSRLVEGGRDFATGQVTVSGAGTGALSGMTRGGLLTAEQLRALETIDGVAAVAPIVMFPAADAPAALPLTLAPVVFGVDMEALALNRRSPRPRVSAGRLVPAPASDEAVLGNQVARLYHVGPGDPITVRGQRFRVVGVLEPTLTGPDSFVFMSFPTAQRLLIDSEPLLRRLLLVPGSNLLPIATAAAVFWASGQDPEAVAARIRERLPGLSVVSPHDASIQLDRALAFLNAVIVGSGLVALLVASLAVTNTMFMAVVERRREIGLRRVVGATRRQVIAQLLVEAATLGILGSTLGLGAGALGVSGLNTLTERLGAATFLLTPRLAAAAALLPAGLAAIAGLWPAWRAARLPPTEAIRYA